MDLSPFDKFIMKHQFELTSDDWSDISEKYDLSIEMLRLNQTRLNWEKIAKYQNLSIQTIKEFIKYQLRDYVNIICKEQYLTEEFVSQYADIVNWDLIRANQKFSLDFYLTHLDDIKKFKEKEEMPY